MESGQGEELSETEIEAVQSGEQLLPRSSNYRYADARRRAIMLMMALRISSLSSGRA